MTPHTLGPEHESVNCFWFWSLDFTYPLVPNGLDLQYDFYHVHIMGRNPRAPGAYICSIKRENYCSWESESLQGGGALLTLYFRREI